MSQLISNLTRFSCCCLMLFLAGACAQADRKTGALTGAQKAQKLEQIRDRAKAWSQEREEEISEGDQEKILTLLQEVQGLGKSEALLKVSESFLGVLASWTPPRSKKEDDQRSYQELLAILAKDAPKETVDISLDCFNCYSYSKIPLAIVFAEEPTIESFLKTYKEISYYNSEVSTAFHRHFTSADLLPALNDELHFLKDVTKDIANLFDSESLKTHESLIDRSAFIKTLHPAYFNKFMEEAPVSLQTPESVSIPYIEFDKMWPESTMNDSEYENFLIQEKQLFESFLEEENTLGQVIKEFGVKSDQFKLAAKKWSEASKALENLRYEQRMQGVESIHPEFIQSLPKISLVSLVVINQKVAKGASGLNVKHMGYVIRKGEKAIFRHAKTSGDKQVKDYDFEEYFKNYLVTSSLETAKSVDPETEEIFYDHTKRRSDWRGLNFTTVVEGDE